MRTAVVVGGGIGGLAAAIGLVRAGWDVRIHERAPQFTEVGAGISVWGNALTALDALGVGDEVRARAAATGFGGVRDSRGRWLVRGAGSAEDVVMIHRADLLDVLLGAVPADCLNAGRRVERVAIDGDRAVVEGTTVDLLVGADGLRSQVRATLWPEAGRPRYTGSTAWRTIAPADGIPFFEGSETWKDRFAFGAFPMVDDQVYCYISAAAPEGQRAAERELAYLRRVLVEWPEPIPALLERFREDRVLRHDLYYLPPLATFVKGPVALLGDAAHAMSPNLGQGACQALEDAVTLAALLSGPDTAAGLREYDRTRRPRTQSVVRQSVRIGRMTRLGQPGAFARNALLRTAPASVARRGTEALLSWQPPGGLPGTP